MSKPFQARRRLSADLLAAASTIVKLLRDRLGLQLRFDYGCCCDGCGTNAAMPGELGMACLRLRVVLGMAVSASMLFASTGAAATTSMSAPQQVNPWATLAMLSGAVPAAAACGAAVAATQAAPSGCVLPVVDAPPPVAQSAPPPPVPIAPIAAPSTGLGLGVDPLLLGLVAVAAGVGLYFVLKHKSSNNGNSPA